MIPQGVDPHDVVDIHGLAYEHGVSLSAARAACTALGHPAPLRERATRRLWWGRQVRAYLDGKPVPPLPVEEQPNDLFDREEAADYCRVTLRVFLREVDTRDDLEAVPVVGFPHYRRCQLRRRPVKAVKAGRPAGEPKPKPEDLALLLATVPAGTVEPAIHELSQQLGVSEETVVRWRARIRKQQLADMLARLPKGSPTPAPDELAVALDVSATTVHRWLTELRGAPGEADRALRRGQLDALAGIAAGLAPGTEPPTVRQLATRLGTSPGTVYRRVAELKDLGLWV